jgi:SAM-dependent methyltransferase
VDEETVFRTDLYKSTAAYYDRFRPPYPPALFEDLRVRAAISGSGRLLDLACGTGQITFALAGDFRRVWAVDQEEESVAFGQAKADSLGVDNVVWLNGRAEDVILDGDFELVAIGNAFQRLRRRVVAERALSWLAPRGCVALLWGGIPWLGDLAWQQEMAALVQHWMDKVGATDRVPAGWAEAIEREPHPRVLEGAGFSVVGSFDFPVEHTWTLETLTGYVYSTSLLNPLALGPARGAFEQDLRARLLVCEPTGQFDQQTSFAYDLGRRPA